MTCLLTKHDEGGCPLFVSRRVGGVLAGISTGVGHFKVRNPNGRVLQGVVEEDNPVLEGRVGETLSVDRVVHSNVVPLTINGFPNPRHLSENKSLRFLFVQSFSLKSYISIKDSGVSSFHFKVRLIR